MSRHIHKIPEKNLTIAYGLDHAIGYFIQVFDDTKQDDDEDYMILDKSSYLNQSTPEK